MTLAELTQMLSGSGYVPKTEEELEQQAQRRYRTEYDARKLGARQAWEQGDLALVQRLAGLDKTYEGQMEKLAADTRRGVSEADRSALMRGMQRSSYSAQTQAGIRQAGLSGLAGLRQSLLDEKSALEAQRAQLASQLADKLAQYDISFSTDVQAYLDTLRDREQERAREAREYADRIAMALYEYGQKAAKGGYAGGGGKSGGGSKKSASAASQTGTGSAKGAGDSAIKAAEKGAKAAAGAASLIQRLTDTLRGFSKN